MWRKLFTALFPGSRRTKCGEPFIMDIDVPRDIQEFGNRHKIPSFADFTYRQGFMAGWRAAIKHKAKMEK